MQFEVRDTGAGIAPELQGAIFQPFHQLPAGRPGKPGTGLGLSISRRLVELMGGELRVESAPGRGSCFGFTLVLPVTQPPRATLTQSRVTGYGVRLGESWWWTTTR